MSPIVIIISLSILSPVPSNPPSLSSFSVLDWFCAYRSWQPGRRDRRCEPDPVFCDPIPTLTPEQYSSGGSNRCDATCADRKRALGHGQGGEGVWGGGRGRDSGDEPKEKWIRTFTVSRCLTVSSEFPPVGGLVQHQGMTQAWMTQPLHLVEMFMVLPGTRDVFRQKTVGVL